VKRYFATAAMLLLLTGCVTRQPAEDDLQSAAHTWKKRVVQAPNSTPGTAEQWAFGWNLDDDPELRELIIRAAAANQDLRELFARREAARAGVRSARADLWPIPRINMRTQRSKITERDVREREAGDLDPVLLTLENPSTRHALGLEANYEIDLWGRVRSAIAAAAADLRASEHNLRAAQISIAADIALEYFAIRNADRQLVLRTERENLLRDLVRREQARLSAGISDATPLLRAERDLLAVQQDSASLRQSREEAQNRLALLLGVSPSEFTLASRSDWVVPRPAPPALLPAAVLESRPDIAGARERLYAADARLGEAQAARLPTLTLTGLAGFASDALHRLVRKDAREWSIGAGLQLPLFDGRLQAQTEVAAAETVRLRAAYWSTALRAFSEVENSLSALAASYVREESARATHDSLAKTVSLLGAQVAAGRTSRLPLIARQTEEVLAQEALYEAERDRLASSVALLRALGIAWTHS
jgi:outer membrane protein, multidrug efflux system